MKPKVDMVGKLIDKYERIYDKANPVISDITASLLATFSTVMVEAYTAQEQDLETFILDINSMLNDIKALSIEHFETLMEIKELK